MNGAQSVLRTLLDAGVDVCFANPGTSEMHLVAALDAFPAMRAVLGLSEGVVTGAADGYARITGTPAAALLHLGPGLANGWANLHNARRAGSPVVAIVGDHATYHKRFDAPLESDIESLADPLRGWVRRSSHAADAGADTAAAVAAAMDPPGRVASLLLPGDVSWGDGGVPVEPIPPKAPRLPGEAAIAAAAGALRDDEPTTLLLGGPACTEAGLRAASRIARATGARVLVETFPARLPRGAGLPSFDRLGYLPEQAAGQLDGTQRLVLAGARSPATFFGYPDHASDLVPEGARVHQLAGREHDATRALEDLAGRVAPEYAPLLAEQARPTLPGGALTVQNWVEVIGALLPDNAIVADESNTSGLLLPQATAGAPRHDLLTLTGGAIGQGMPVATGAAIAARDRPVINLEADGSAMYTLPALWTQAREQLDVTTVVLNNRAYAILRMELGRVGAEPSGAAAKSLFDLSTPDIDFTAMASGMGVPASRATTAEELADQFRRATSEPGPHLIEAMVPPLA
ncbi:acetolactate synthase large subunit [Haloechinothrix sp. LS1_15]|uniref:acetolactate synthase large subunit n=1 Tax=Haloechinothrix sp. LS1_15 TaxID=2652248 RepID=UPI0029452B6F|nr:acetolactate synthase large subunit [Haloechinothrix sp. LS1_15]MDV6011719.1 acetolactate synthase large subunit [Haloechinothrix sp. LS1_15]